MANENTLQAAKAEIVKDMDSLIEIARGGVNKLFEGEKFATTAFSLIKNAVGFVDLAKGE